MREKEAGFARILEDFPLSFGKKKIF